MILLYIRLLYKRSVVNTQEFFSEWDPGVLAAETEGPAGQDGGDEEDGGQERGEDVAHGQQFF